MAPIVQERPVTMTGDTTLDFVLDRVRISMFGAVRDAAPCAGAIQDALTALIENERDRRLWQAVAALPSGERTAVYLYYRQEMSVSDAAHALGVTTGTIKTLLFRARRRLRPALAASGYARHQEERS
jgi:RNA polymerase sigma factor (sigma-70 family)